MVSAFLHAREGQYSPEIDLLRKIDRFGIEAITGRRQFYFGELRAMILAENIVTAYKNRAQSENWATWARANPAMAEMLVEAEKLCL
jgi:hypothetical protein